MEVDHESWAGRREPAENGFPPVLR